jgi:NitT/TauT family transport system permease protein
MVELRALQWSLLAAMLALWHWVTRNPDVAFFFGEPLVVFRRIWTWFTRGDGSLQIGPGRAGWFTLHLPAEIYPHLIVTLSETVIAFVIGAALGTAAGLWLALAPRTGVVLHPYVKAANSMTRVILAPIFATWFGLGIWSKVALAITLVFFVVFFNVSQGVREANATLVDNARMLGMSERQLLRHVYWPSALSWMFSSLHTSVGFAVVGAVVGEYLGASAGLGYLIQQAEGVFDVAGVFAGMIVLAVVVMLIDMVVGRVERRLLVWRPDGTRS